MMWGGPKEEWTQDHELVAIAAMIESMRAALVAGQDCVCDNTHLVPRLPRWYRNEYAPMGVAFKVHSFMHVPIEECIARDSVRTGGVGETVIRELAARYEGAGRDGWRLTDRWMNHV